MKKHTKKLLETYNQTAGKLADIYNAMSSSEVLPGLEECLPDPKGKNLWALDIACGSGRDAKWLAQKGFHVIACDGAPEMIKLAEEKQAHERVNYLVDLMPKLENVRATGQKFDVITISAAWMHLDKVERKQMFGTLCDIANEGALAYISLRQGPSPADRPMFSVTVEELEELAEKEGKILKNAGTAEDKQNRDGVSWSYVTLRM